MSTTQIAAALFQLQQLDLELERLIAEQQAVANSLQGNVTLQKLRKEQNLAQQQLNASLQAQKEAEWTLEELDNRLKMQEQRLYSGMVTNPKELHALQQEVLHLRTQQSHQEEVALEMMEAADTLKEQLDRKTEALRDAEEAWGKENATLVARRSSLETKRQELEIQRAKIAAAIDPQLLSRYDTMRRSKQGRAISKVEQSSCQWCRVILTASELQRVRTSTELQTCSNCGRILYYDR